MQLASLTTARLVPGPKPSADHASFDVLDLTRADGSDLRVGLVPHQLFYTQRGSSWEDAVAGAKELAAKRHGAFAVLAAHAGMLFVVPAFVRGTDPANTRLDEALTALAGATPVGRHGAALAIVGADQVIDLRPLAPTLGSGRG